MEDSKVFEENGSTSLIVFIDKKWFYLSQKSEKYYLLPEEDDPHRTCKNKNYIPRLMFLCVFFMGITRITRFRDGNCIFDGRIGCFPLVQYKKNAKTMEDLVPAVQQVI